MKTAIKKTESEIAQQAQFVPIKLKDYRVKYDYWQCESCHILFEPEDTVMMKTAGDRRHSIAR